MLNRGRGGGRARCLSSVLTSPLDVRPTRAHIGDRPQTYGHKIRKEDTWDDTHTLRPAGKQADQHTTTRREAGIRIGREGPGRRRGHRAAESKGYAQKTQCGPCVGMRAERVEAGQGRALKYGAQL